jgi:hypothetical protein
MDFLRFKLQPDPDDPVNFLLLTGDVARLASVFHPSRPFWDCATPINAEAIHAHKLMTGESAGPPLTDGETAAQVWRLESQLYKALYEAIALRGDKIFHAPAKGSKPLARRTTAGSTTTGSNVSSMSAIPAPPPQSSSAKSHRTSASSAFKVPPSVPSNMAQQLQSIQTELSRVARDIVKLNEKMTASTQIWLEMRDMLRQDAMSSSLGDPEADEPPPKRGKANPAAEDTAPAPPPAPA